VYPEFFALLGVAGLLAHRSSEAAWERASDDYQRDFLALSVSISSDPLSLRNTGGSNRVGRHPGMPYRITPSTLTSITDADIQQLRSWSRRAVAETVESLEKLSAEFPSALNGYWQLARAYRLLERVDESCTNARHVLQIDSDFVPVAVRLKELGGEHLPRHERLPEDSWQS
jgi:hypothetical protein